MRSILRSSTLLAALATALVAVAVPASAGTATAANAVRPSTAPTAILTGARITFTTNDEDKDADTQVLVQVHTPTTVAAEVIDYFDHFDDRSVHGPYSMFTFANITAADLNTGAVSFIITPFGNDTWRFNYSIAMTFSDGTSFTFGENNKSLSQSNRSFRTPFTFTTQVAVPNVIGRNLSSATTALQAAGLTVGTVTHRIDSTCTFVNTVAAENPGAGSAVSPGTPVNLTIGDKPRTPCP